MATANESYDFIKSKIDQYKSLYPSLREKSDDFVFSALTIKTDYYKNPAYQFSESDMLDTIVDGTNDGGVDALLIDPESEPAYDLILVQSKFYSSISFDQIRNAINKLVAFYNNMCDADDYNISDKVKTRFQNLASDVGDESKIVFVIYTSSKQSGIRHDKLEKVFRELLPDSKYVLRVLFSDDVVSQIKEAESRLPSVQYGELTIDRTNNYLEYNDEAIIVNGSASCIKQLYEKNGLNILSRNLRYHVSTGRAIDIAIKDTIKNDPDCFWFKNNGLTILCDSFEISGDRVKMNGFSIVNGGQTTYNLSKSPDLKKGSDFYIPCKIITIRGDNDNSKNAFALTIAQATNSQKAIKAIDLKANSPEQISFAKAMTAVDIFYQTKRGQEPPANKKVFYKNSDLAEVGKLCLAGVFQKPAASRNKPSIIYNPEFYEPIFNSDQNKIAIISKELLYVDYYFRYIFTDKFDANNKTNPNAAELIPFAHNSRTMCIAFVAFASRYHSGNIDNDDLRTIFRNISDDSYKTKYYDIFRDISTIPSLFSASLFSDKDKLDDFLYQLFDIIIKCGRKCYSSDKKYDQTLNESNYLKKDTNYYLILKSEWDLLVEKITDAYNNI